MTAKLLNIGPKSEAWLRQVGVRTLDDLKQHGALGTFLKVKRAGFKPSLNLLYALAGAELGCHWTALTPEHKNELVLAVSASDDAIALAKKRISPARDVTPPRAESAESLDDGGGMAEPSLFDDPDAGDHERDDSHDSRQDDHS
jgi:hypothetical protein